MKLRSKPSSIATPFWLGITLLFYTLIYFQKWPTLTYSLAPIYFIINPLFLKTTTYSFQDDHLAVSSFYFNKTLIAYNSINHIVIKDSTWTQQLMGMPPKVTLVNYGKYDSLNILNTSPKMIRQLLRVADNAALARVGK